MKKIILLSLLLRLIVALFAYHSDVFDQLNWAKDLESLRLAGFYIRDIADAGSPNYPPLYYLTIYANNKIYLLLREILWSINDRILVFPSNAYLWFESDLGRIYFNKLLPIFCDLGIGFLICLIIKKLRDKKTGLAAASFYLFFPITWYISAVWGQTDSLFLLPLLTAFFLLLFKKKSVLSLVLFTTSFLIKPTSVFLLPLILTLSIKRGIYSFTKGSILSLIIFLVVHIPFGLSLAPGNLIKFYTLEVREISGYISSNAFNFWGIIFGFGPIKDSLVWYGLTVNLWGLLLTFTFGIYLIYRFIKADNVQKQILTATLWSMSIFLFASRMHERYFYLSYIFLIVSGFLYKKIKWVLYLGSFIFFVNLYHFWWVPGGDTFKYILSNRLVEVIFCLGNIFLFFYLERFREKIKLNEKFSNQK